jgi:hypothetical protein
VSQARYTEPMAEDPNDLEAPSDVVLLAGPTEDGEGFRVVRAREQRLEAGEVRPLKDGKPLGSGEIVKLAPRAGSPRLCDVEVVARIGPESRGSGPPQVATAAYRESWDRIFGEANEPRALN